MARRLWVAVAVVVAVALVSFITYWEARQVTAPTVKVGSGSIALMQQGAGAPLASLVSAAPNSPISMSLASPSTAGTALIAVVGTSVGGTGAAGSVASLFPSGWTRLIARAESTNSDLEIWAYLNNPGGISAVSFTAGGQNLWHVSLSEWSGVIAASALETSGSATATSGTTLVPATSGNVVSSGDLVIAAWMQQIAGSTCTFTSPAGFTRLTDDGATNLFQHLDVEYQLNAALGAPLSPTLTSNQTTVSASGAVIVLKAAPPITDQTALLRNGSISVKVNTADFGLIQGGKLQLEDGSGGYLLEDGSGLLLIDTVIPSLGDPVTITNPAWSGRVVSVNVYDLTELKTNYRQVDVSATNTATAGSSTAPADLSDVPSASYLLQEDGVSHFLTEDGSGVLLLEGASYGYQGLTVRTTQNIDGTVTTYGSATVFVAGFAAGQTFLLTSANLGYSAQPFAITNVTNNWLDQVPIYILEFGDAYQTLQQAGGGVLTRQGSQAATQPGVIMPGGVLGIAQITANQAGISAEADITGLTVTVNVTAGRRIRIAGLVDMLGTVVNDQSQLTAYDGATQVQQVIMRHAAIGHLAHPLEVFLQPTAGVHTYKLTAKLASGTGTFTVTAAATQPAYLVVEDVGT